MASWRSVALSTIKFEPQPLKTHVAPSLSTSSKRSSAKPQSDVNLETNRQFGFEEAIHLLKEGVKTEPLMYIPLLQRCLDDNLVFETERIHAHMYKTGAHQYYFVMTFLVNVYARCGSMGNARRVFENLTRRNVVAWTNLMTGYVWSSRPEVAVQVFVEMLEAGSRPSDHTLAMALNACTALCSVELGKQFHGFIFKFRIDHNLSIGNVLCSLYSKFGKLECAVKAFERIVEKDVISWTSVISACGDHGQAGMGLKFFGEMLLSDINPNELTLTKVLSLCSATMALSLGAQVHAMSIKLACHTNVRLANSLTYLYLKCGLVDEANSLFNRMESVSLVTWNAMIAGHAQAMDVAMDDLSAQRSGTEAFGIYLKLNQSNLKPDIFTFSSILAISARLLALEQGEQIHAQSLKAGLLSDTVVGTALVNMYGKCGNAAGARKAFLEMPIRTLISWTTMISGLALQGRYQLALQLFEDMRLTGTKPNQITFVAVLAACSRAGMVNRALEYFEQMQKEYRIKPVMDHYTCLIEMFARHGRLNEALDFIKEMKIELTETIWLLIIAGCKNHRNDEVGFHAAEELLKLKPKAADTYVFLSSMYAAAERWEDVSRLRKSMCEENIVELYDCSFIRIKGCVYSMETNEQMYPQMKRLHELLDGLHYEALRNGYTELLNVEAVQKGEGKMSSSNVYNSEKLALACGLLNTHSDSPILITKRTAMHRDCHSFMKILASFFETYAYII